MRRRSAALEDVEMRRCATCRKSARAQAPAAFGIAHVFTSARRSCSRPTATSSTCCCRRYLHEDVTRQLLEAGKSVFVEKPMGLSAGDVQGAGRAGRSRRGLRLGVNHNFLFLPGYEALRARCRRRRARRARPRHRQLAVRARPDPVRAVQQLDPRLRGQPAVRAGLAPRRFRHRSARAARRADGGRVARRSSCPAISASTGTGTRSAAAARTSVSLNLSVAPGQPDRSVHRARLGGGRHASTSSATCTGASRRAATAPCSIRCTRRGRWRAQIGAPGLAQRRPPARPRPSRGRRTTTAFQDSISNSVAAFYRTFDGGLDPRLAGQLRRRGHPPVRAHRRRRGRRAGVAAQADPHPRRRAARAADACWWSAAPASSASAWSRRWSSAASACASCRAAVARRASRSTGLPVDVVQGSHDDRAALDRALRGHRGRLPPRQGHGPALGGLRRRRRRADARSRRGGAGARRQALHLHRHDRFLRFGRRPRP